MGKVVIIYDMPDDFTTSAKLKIWETKIALCKITKV